MRKRLELPAYQRPEQMKYLVAAAMATAIEKDLAFHGPRSWEEFAKLCYGIARMARSRDRKAKWRRKMKTWPHPDLKTVARIHSYYFTRVT
jgi:hypothetical protein